MKGRRLLPLLILALAACGKGGSYEKKELGDGTVRIRNAHGIFKYVSAANAKEAGIGARIALEDGVVVVREVFPGSPARSAGLQPADRLLELDGKPLTASDAATAAEKIKGPPGSPLRLKVERAGKAFDLSLERADDVMLFVEFPEGFRIEQAPKPKPGERCSERAEPDCRFLIESRRGCFYSCPLAAR